MSSEARLESLWEKFTDTLGSLSEGVVGFIFHHWPDDDAGCGENFFEDRIAGFEAFHPAGASRVILDTVRIKLTQALGMRIYISSEVDNPNIDQAH